MLDDACNRIDMDDEENEDSMNNDEDEENDEENLTFICYSEGIFVI